MRQKERISLFLNKLNFNKLEERWDIDISQDLRGEIFNQAKEYWEQNPDQRFGQVLINLNLIPDNFDIWSDEESDILDAQGVPKRETMMWGTNFDKDMNRLPETIWKPINELTTDHIEAILDGNWARNPKYIEEFKNELELRKLN